MKKSSFLAVVLALVLGASVQATTVRFIPTDLEIKSQRFLSHIDNRFLKVNNFGEVIYQSNDGKINLWQQNSQQTLADCRDASAVVYLSSDGGRALYECADGYTIVVNFAENGIERHVVHTIGAGVSKNSYDPTIAAKNGRVINMHPHVTSRPRQGEARIATSTGNDSAYQNYTLSYFDRPELGRVRVSSFSPNANYVVLNGSEHKKYVMDLASQNYQQLNTETANFRGFSLVSNDGSKVVANYGRGNSWFCQQQVGIWQQNTGVKFLTSLNADEETAQSCYSAQDMSASASVVLALSHRYQQSPEGHIWTRWSNDLKSFETFVTQYGGQLGSWSNLIPLSVSEDGLFIAGVGTDAEGRNNRVFVLEIDPLAECEVRY